MANEIKKQVELDEAQLDEVSGGRSQVDTTIEGEVSQDKTLPEL